MKATIFFILLFTFANVNLFGQKVSIHFKDTSSGKAITDVSVFDIHGNQLGIADTNGVVKIADANSPIVAIALGYKVDTLLAITNQTVYLSPLSVMLKQSVVRANQVERVFHSGQDYVLDYEFYGDNILVASYSGNSGKSAKLLLLTPRGDTLAVKMLSEKPIAVFKDCLGDIFCVFKNKFCHLSITSDSINIVRQYDIKLFDMIKQCQQCIGDIQYFKINETGNKFHTIYGWQKVGDTSLHYFMNLNRDDVKKPSDDEFKRAMELYNAGQFEAARRILALRELWDRSPLKGLNVPLYVYQKDSLLLFDFHKRQIYTFDQSGSYLTKHDIHFPYSDVLFFDILKDDKTGKFYLYRHRSQQTIQELSIARGEVAAAEIKMKWPCNENVKIHNGDIYYLWQGKNGSTRQLFVQHTSN